MVEYRADLLGEVALGRHGLAYDRPGTASL
jgi:hypothetical protein